jgi:hypothetical protein
MAAAPPQRLNLSKTNFRRAPKRDLLPPLDWTAGHGPVTGALSAASGAEAVAMVGTLAHMPPGWPLAIGAAGALGHGIGNSLRRRLTGRSMVTRSASWLLAGGWTSFAIATSPLTWLATGTLAALGVGIGAMASSAAWHEEAVEEERLAEQRRNQPPAPDPDDDGFDPWRRQMAEQWRERVWRICHVAIKVVAVERWENGAGFSIGALLEQSASGAVTWQRVDQGAKAMAGDARLPLGCAISVEEGHQQGTVILDIPTENVMAGLYEYPDDLSELSINGPIPWGLLGNAQQIAVSLREACALFLGPPGSGKTTFCDGVLCGFYRCTDVIVWAIDFNAGSLGLPHVEPWLEAQGLRPADPSMPALPKEARPGIDWLASTPGEALKMVEALIRINAARKVQYADLMRRNNTRLLPISAQVPQIVLMVDEGAELLSASNLKDPAMRDLKDGIREVMRTTRAMGIREILTAVDGNVSALGDTQIRKFSPVGVALTSGESSGNNLAKLFPSARVDTSQLNEKGSGVIGSATADGFAPRPFKAWNVTPATIRRVQAATWRRRPALDKVSAQAAGEDYAQRWSTERAGWMWNVPEEDGPGVYTDQPKPADRPGLNLRSLRPDQPTPRPSDAEMDALAAEFMDEIDAQFGTTQEPGTGKPSGLNLSALRDQAPGAGPDWLPDALAAIRDAGPAGMKPSAVADAVGRGRMSVREGLKAAAERGELVYRDRGPHSVYVHPDHA